MSDAPQPAEAQPAPAVEPAPAAPGRRRRRRLLLALAPVAALSLLAALVAAGLPPRDEVRALADSAPPRTQMMQQRIDEAEAAGRRFRLRHRPVPLARVSRELLVAVVAAEDARFFDHEGFDWEAVREAARVNWERRRLARGASTLSQQLTKNLFFSTEKSPLRKLREAIVTRWVEQDLSKRRILELYVNSVEWGAGVFGCESAAQRWFGVGCAGLDAAQAAGLVAMLPSPHRINPEVSPRTWGRARERVQRMVGDASYVRSRIERLGLGVPGDASAVQ